MNCHGGADEAPTKAASIILVGNHFAGKSLIFPFAFAVGGILNIALRLL